MSDLFDRVTADQDPLKRIASKIPGFDGYIEQTNRRNADKLLREQIADRYAQLKKQVGELQHDFANSGELTYLDELETAATKLGTFIDKIENAAYGYSSFFEAVKIGEEELARLYQFDSAFLDLEDEVRRGIDNVAASVDTDGMPAAVRHLVGLARDLVTTFDRRQEVITAIE